MAGGGTLESPTLVGEVSIADGFGVKDSVSSGVWELVGCACYHGGPHPCAYGQHSSDSGYKRKRGEREHGGAKGMWWGI